jgi:ATP-dependent 26S proteasome regulatory subunit
MSVDEEQDSVEFEAWLADLGHRTAGCSAPEIIGMCNEAGLGAIREHAGRNHTRTKDMLDAPVLVRRHFEEAISKGHRRG